MKCLFHILLILSVLFSEFSIKKYTSVLSEVKIIIYSVKALKTIPSVLTFFFFVNVKQLLKKLSLKSFVFYNFLKLVLLKQRTNTAKHKNFYLNFQKKMLCFFKRDI